MRTLPVERGALVALASGWIVTAVATVFGLDLSLIDVLVLFGVAVVLPLVLGGRGATWVVVAAATFASFRVPTGWAASALVLPLLVVAALGVLAAARTWLAGRTLDASVSVLVRVYAAVAAGALAQSRLGLVLLDLHEPIIELTTVHYVFAGAASLQLSRWAGVTGARPRLASVGLLATGVAPPIVAAGFLTRNVLPQVGGAVLMTLGVWCTAILELHAARDRGRARRVRALLLTSGLAVWAPMVLAVAWAMAEHWDVPALSIPDMARTHGIANAFGFVLCGLLARRLGDA